MTDLFEIEAPTTTTSLELRRLQRDARRRQRRVRTLLASAIGIVVFALAASAAWNFVQALRPESTGVADFEGSGQGQVQIIINPGDSGDVIAQTLYDNGVVASKEAFILATFDNPDAAKKIQPGYYVLPKEMNAKQALGALLDNDRRITKDITIPEGYTRDQILNRVASVTGYSIEEVEAAAADLEALGLPEEAGGNLEGWLFPATYHFNPDVTPTEVFATMVDSTITVLEDVGVPRDQWQRTIIIASLVEKEAGSDADRGLVASVIVNRLNGTKTNGYLQLCSTVRYFLPGGIGVTAAETQTPHPYNTYLNPGLPPGPIASPGQASIEAAFDPPDTNFYYFTTVNPATGETHFRENYWETAPDREEYHQWCLDNGGC